MNTFINYLKALGCILLAALGWNILIVIIGLFMLRFLPVSALSNPHPWLPIIIGCSLGGPCVYVCSRIFKIFNL